jgi:hypothetical protein
MEAEGPLLLLLLCLPLQLIYWGLIPAGMLHGPARLLQGQVAWLPL